MVVGSTTVEIVSVVEAKRVRNAVVKNAQSLFPSAAPELSSIITTFQGNGGVGSINQVDFTIANKDCRFVKKRVDEIDEEKMVYKVSQVEGGMVGKTCGSVELEFKFRGGCVITWTCHFDTLPSAILDQTKS